MTDSLLEHLTLKSRGLTWIETYLGLTWLAESWENQVVLLFFSRFRWALKAEKKTVPTEDLNWSLELAPKGPFQTGETGFIWEGYGFPWGLICLCFLESRLCHSHWALANPSGDKSSPHSWMLPPNDGSLSTLVCIRILLHLLEGAISVHANLIALVTCIKKHRGYHKLCSDLWFFQYRIWGKHFLLISTDNRQNFTKGPADGDRDHRACVHDPRLGDYNNAF